MTAKTAVKNFTIQRRADFPMRLIFKDANGTAVNITGSPDRTLCCPPTDTSPPFRATVLRKLASESVGSPSAITETLMLCSFICATISRVFP